MVSAIAPTITLLQRNAWIRHLFCRPESRVVVHWHFDKSCKNVLIVWIADVLGLESLLCDTVD